MLSGPGNTRPQYQHYSGHSQHPPAWMSMMNTLNVLSGSFKERHLTLVWAGPGAELWQLPMVEQVPCPVAGHWSPLLWWTLSEDIHKKLGKCSQKDKFHRLAMHYWLMMWCDGPLCIWSDENEVVLTGTVPLIMTAFLSWSTIGLVCRYLAAMTMSEWNMHSLHSYGYWSMEQGDWRPRQGRGANILQSELNLDNIITSCSE